MYERFARDLEEVYLQFEVDDEKEISEVTMTEIMILMGFVKASESVDLEAVQVVWNLLRPIQNGNALEGADEEPELADNGERVPAKRLRTFMAAILGYQVTPPAESTNNELGEQIGTIDLETGDLHLTDVEIKRIRKRFSQLSQNRLDHVMK